MKVYKHRLATLVVTLISALSIYAYDFEVDGICYDIVSIEDLSVEIAHTGNSYYSSSSYSGDFIIPSSVTYSNRQLTVVGIGYSAFYKSGITSVIIPNSVTSIGSHAFSNCDNLSEIDIPNSVTSIGDYAFSNCDNLSEIDIPNSVTSIGDYAFSSCDNLSEIDIPNSVTSIGDYAFSNCALLSKIKLSDKLTNIAYSAFAGCNNLSSITIPSSVEDIDDHALECPKEMIFLEGTNSITIKGYFTESQTLEKIIIGRNIITYSGNKYNDPFANLKEIEIKDNVTDINWLMSYYERKRDLLLLEKIKFGSGLSKLLSLSHCNNLKTIILTSNTPQDIEEFTNAQYINVNVIVPKGSLESYMQHAVWKKFWNISEGDVHSGIDDVIMPEHEITVKSVTVNKVGLAITIESAENMPVSVYSIVGTAMYQTPSYKGEQIDLAPGLYIVKCGSQALKIKI